MFYFKHILRGSEFFQCRTHSHLSVCVPTAVGTRMQAMPNTRTPRHLFLDVLGTYVSRCFRDNCICVGFMAATGSGQLNVCIPPPAALLWCLDALWMSFMSASDLPWWPLMSCGGLCHPMTSQGSPCPWTFWPSGYWCWLPGRGGLRCEAWMSPSPLLLVEGALAIGQDRISQSEAKKKSGSHSHQGDHSFYTEQHVVQKTGL